MFVVAGFKSARFFFLLFLAGVMEGWVYVRFDE